MAQIYFNTHNGTVDGYANVYESYVGTSSENYSIVQVDVYFHRNNVYGGVTNCDPTYSTITLDGTENQKTGLFEIPGTTSSYKPYTLLHSYSKRVDHNANGSKSITVKYKCTNYIGSTAFIVDEVSQSVTLTNIPRYAQAYISKNSKTETSYKINWSADAAVNAIYVSTNGGSTWSSAIAASGTSGTYNITGLTAGTSYNFKVKVRRSDSNLVSDDYASSNLSDSTYSYPYIVEAYNINIGNTIETKLYNDNGRTCILNFYDANDSSQSPSPIFTYTTSTIGTNIIQIPTDSSKESILYGIMDGDTGNYYITVEVTDLHTSSASTTKDVKATATRCKPTISNTSSVVESNQTILALTNNNHIFIKDKSSALVTIVTDKISDTLDTNATITSRSINGVAIAGSSKTFNFVTESSFSLKITNSRGIESDAYILTPTYHDYFNPTINESSYIKRPSQTSDKMVANFSGSFFNGYFDSGEQNLNEIKIECYVRERENDNWTHCFSTNAYRASSTTSFVLGPGDDTDYELGINSYDSDASVELYNPLPGATQGKWNYQKKYFFELRITDTLYDELELNYIAYPQQVGMGQPYFEWWRENDTNIFNVNGEYYKNGVPFGGGGGVSGDTLPIGSIVEYNGSSVPEGYEEVNDYSTSEVKTGSTWIDNKPIYRKVINFGSLPNNSYKDVSTGLSNVSYTHIYGIAKATTGVSLTMPFVTTTSANCVAVSIQSNGAYVRVQTGTDRSNFIAYLILEYTKTTD